ncbi:hypothetical protein [Mucilaginibacter phyllosphaerae]|uniref:Uncharacterized protein n=1 Tax=Mucilaginibacter phyllosphaerae TaxID=1812349 RepID=A0A4Y8AJE2_9SPHI|nr:hypothetical protein [Mucilaginibacter phyllosphaerae]MBB3968371.1 hypothetical protein [Mucilaginibacter phyllosphaerae]TEW68631.1 hypothetical protein E2R65_00255 [Mucilaginibacter phyllosphaerae]GGG99396.1 hypothetical protein GCM10007352_00210 [Mucilaginibacter phyllosphaerae]
MKKYILNFILLILCLSSGAQINDNKIRLSVLKKGITNHTFIFGKWTKEGNTETHLNYLGTVTTAKGKAYKLMTSVWYWGLSHRATSGILLFSIKNKQIGIYHLGSVTNIPDKLINGKLFFTNADNSDCDNSVTTIIDFTQDIPKQIFLKCKGNYGDLYYFSQE